MKKSLTNFGKYMKNKYCKCNAYVSKTELDGSETCIHLNCKVCQIIEKEKQKSYEEGYVEGKIASFKESVTSYPLPVGQVSGLKKTRKL